MDINLRDLRKASGYFFWLTIVWLLYGHSLFFNFFVFDDALHISNNVHTGVRFFSDLFFFWQNSLTPVIFFVWQLISLVFTNAEPAPFRALNFFLLAGIAKIMFDLIYDYFEHQKLKSNFLSTWAPIFLVLLYIVHPSQVESVVWISSGRTLMATFFALCSIKYFISAGDNNEFSKESFFTVLFFVLGLLSKPSIVFTPVIMVLVSFAYGRGIKNPLKKTWPILMVGLILSLMHVSNVYTSDKQNLNLSGRFVLFVDSFAYYYRLVLLPFVQSFDYGRDPITIILEWESQRFLFYFPSIVILLFLSFLGYFKQLRSLFFGFIAFYILIFPNMGLLYFDFQNISTVSSRYLNFPLVILVFSLAPFIYEFRDYIETKKRNTSYLAIIAFVALFVSNFYYSRLWNSSTRVLESSKQKTGPTYALSISLGKLYFESGDYQKSESAFWEAWKLDQEAYEPVAALIELYSVYQNFHRINNFLSSLERQMVNVGPEQAFNLANFYYSLGRYEIAKRYALVSYNSKIEELKSLDIYNSCNYKLENKIENSFNTLIMSYMLESRIDLARKLIDMAQRELPNSEIIKKRIEEVAPNYQKANEKK